MNVPKSGPDFPLTTCGIAPNLFVLQLSGRWRIVCPRFTIILTASGGGQALSTSPAAHLRFPSPDDLRGSGWGIRPASAVL